MLPIKMQRLSNWIKEQNLPRSYLQVTPFKYKITNRYIVKKIENDMPY